MHHTRRWAAAAVTVIAVLAGTAGAAAATAPAPAAPAFPSFPTTPTFPSFPAPTPIPSIPFPTPPSFPSFPSFPPFPGSPPPVEPTATLSNGTVTIRGGNGDNQVSILPTDVVTNANSTVRGGTTSVALDLPLLQQAAGLSLTGASTAGRPASPEFLAGFPILPTTDFRYTPSPFSPAGGTIRHRGTVTFNGTITVGNFDIGFDAARATNGRSGFFVASTTGLRGVLFDLGAPSSVSSGLNRLAIGSTPLKVAPEFAAVLGKSALTGAVVGAARIDALSTPAAGRTIRVTISPGFAQPFRVFDFPAAQVRAVNFTGGSGRNSLIGSRLDLPGGLTLTGGPGTDIFSISETVAGSLTVNTGAGFDSVRVASSVAVTTAVDAGADSDFVGLEGSLFTGDRSFRGGTGSDSAFFRRTDLTAAAFSEFEFLSS